MGTHYSQRFYRRLGDAVGKHHTLSDVEGGTSLIDHHSGFHYRGPTKLLHGDTWAFVLHGDQRNRIYAPFEDEISSMG